jgi:preprotein translocase subunit SecD
MYESFRSTLLSLMICLSLGCATRQEAAEPCPAIAMRVVANTQADSAGTIALAAGDITAASASQAGDEWVVNVTVNDEAAKRVQDFTRQHVGSNMAVVVDGKVQGGTARIAGAITGNKYKIDGFTRADAERLAKTLSDGCLR